MPGVDLEPGADAGAALRAALRALGVQGALHPDGGRRVKHTITHRAIEVEVWEATPRPRPRRAAPRCDGPIRRARELALTALAKKVVAGIKPKRA